jgi:glutamate synthase domain-containing protein 2
MNLQRPNANDALQTKNRSRDVAPQSGICSRCIDGCKGNCDLFHATFRGRELLYPEPFGSITAGADKDYPVDYSHLNIMGYAFGAKGMDPDPDKATFPAVNTETEYGVADKVKMKVPIFTGALGSTDIARKNWEHFAIGAAISGITLVCGKMCAVSIRTWNWTTTAR